MKHTLTASPAARHLGKLGRQALDTGRRRMGVVAERILGDAPHWLGRRMFLAAYQASHAAYWQAARDGVDWRPLGGLLEYDTNLMLLHTDGAAPVCLLTVRARHGRLFHRAEVRVAVKKSGVVYQDTVVVRGLDGETATVALPGLPLKTGVAARAGARPFADVFIKLLSVVDYAGREYVTGRKAADVFRAGFVDCRADQFAVRWGRYWNTVEISRRKQLLRNHWFLVLVKSAGQLWRPLTTRRLAFRVLASPPALALAFWSRNLFHARGLGGPATPGSPATGSVSHAVS